MIKALIVEDESALRELYGRILESKGFMVSYASDGNFAIQCLEETYAPDLIILDIRMPNRNGLEVLEYLQDHPEINNIHVVIATASTDFQEYVSMLPSAEFLLKPVTSRHLTEIAGRIHGIITN